ncbi:MAG TPA: inositol-3-phosphate synthase [Pirellulales bacterium]|jgi:myo-inositol-1-phosphate synthase|nr:inositol-3-phosphate synthase [Pirellulales bacterium]
MAHARIGLWLIGAKGGVATTTLTGLTALKKGLIGNAGLVSALPRFQALDLVDWKDLVVGGHDIRPGRLFDEANRMHTESRAIDADVLRQCKSELDKIEKSIRPGTILNVGPTIAKFAEGSAAARRESPRGAIERIKDDLESFRKANKLAHLIVVNVASTEPPLDPAELPQRWAELNKLLDKPQRCPLAASSLYAIAALDLGCSYVNFTPSVGATPPAIGELAIERGTRHMGYDGKTGETLLKSVLAPMFAKRNLEVMSWVGHNIFGNMDGKVLDDPVNKKSKMVSKDRLLGEILGYPPQTLVSIEYIKSLGDWKTAWDHVHFRGFLGTPMTFQFIWQGCDSLLAAPLVLDLVRFTERAWRRGDVGVLSFLAAFFKSPLGTTEHDFGLQFEMLEAWANANSS